MIKQLNLHKFVGLLLSILCKQAVHVVIGLMPGPSYMTPGLKLEIFGCLDTIPVPTPTEITQDSLQVFIISIPYY